MLVCFFVFAYEAAGASAPGIPCARCFQAHTDLQNPDSIVPRERSAAPISGAFFANINSHNPFE